MPLSFKWKWSLEGLKNAVKQNGSGDQCTVSLVEFMEDERGQTLRPVLLVAKSWWYLMAGLSSKKGGPV